MQPSGDRDDELPRFSRKSPLVPTRKLCPKCLNPLNAGTSLGGWLLPQDYYCTRCGYRGIVYLEKDIEESGSGPEN